RNRPFHGLVCTLLHHQSPPGPERAQPCPLPAGTDRPAAERAPLCAALAAPEPQSAPIMAAMTTHLDHIVIAAPDLNELVTRFTELTGITPVEGGRHNTGSANALVPLSQPAGSYIELIGPDPEAEKLTEDNFALASSAATEPRVAAWCVRPDDLDDFAADKQVEEMSRE